MRAFVTGGTGLLGHNLVEKLQQQGVEVRALVRSLGKASKFFDLEEIDCVHGDLTNIQAFEKSLEGCDVLFHLAAYYREYNGSLKENEVLKDVNVHGTVQLVQAAYKKGIRRIVFVSSAGVLKSQKHIQPDGFEYDHTTKNLYFKSKIEAEQELIKLIQPWPDVQVVILRPSMMMGPGDLDLTPASKFIMTYLSGELSVVPPINLLVSDSRDVADALVKCIKNEEKLKAYTLGGTLISFQDFIHALENISGVKAPTKRPPYFLMLWVLMMLEALGKNPPIKWRYLRRMRHITPQDMTKAQHDLDFTCRPINQTIKDCVNSLQERHTTYK